MQEPDDPEPRELTSGVPCSSLLQLRTLPPQARRAGRRGSQKLSIQHSLEQQLEQQLQLYLKPALNWSSSAKARTREGRDGGVGRLGRCRNGAGLPHRMSGVTWMEASSEAEMSRESSSLSRRLVTAL